MQRCRWYGGVAVGITGHVHVRNACFLQQAAGDDDRAGREGARLLLLIAANDQHAVHICLRPGSPEECTELGVRSDLAGNDMWHRLHAELPQLCNLNEFVRQRFAGHFWHVDARAGRQVLRGLCDSIQPIGGQFDGAVGQQAGQGVRGWIRVDGAFAELGLLGHGIGRWSEHLDCSSPGIGCPYLRAKYGFMVQF